MDIQRYSVTANSELFNVKAYASEYQDGRESYIEMEETA